MYREHKTVLINAYLQLFHELCDKTCIYFLYVYYVLHVLVTILLQSANQIRNLLLQRHGMHWKDIKKKY